MKTEERLKKVGWLQVGSYAYLEIMKRGKQNILFDRNGDEIRLVYGEGITPYKPIGIEIELLCIENDVG